jgi:hypothetical protein
MKKSMKWILGIGIGLVVVAVLVGVGFMIFSHWGAGNVMMSTRIDRFGEGGRGFRDFGMPMTRVGRLPAFGNGGFTLLRVFVSGLFTLGILGLSIYGLISLFRSMRRSPQPAIVQAAVAPAVASTVAPAAVEPVQVSNRICPECAHSVQNDWKNCPYCGHTLDAEIKPETPSV